MTATATVSHDALVEAAKRWLWRDHSIVITELVSGMETPDAIGWGQGRSTLIECKTSRSDFRRDGRKFFRRYQDHGMGDRRFFLTPPGLIPIEEAPDRWGLLELRKSGVHIVKDSGWFHECSRGHEIKLFVSLLRRIGQSAPAGVSVKCYTYKTKDKATMGVGETQEPLEYRGRQEVAESPNAPLQEK